MQETPQRLVRLRKYNRAVNAGIITAIIFLLTYGIALKRQHQFSVLLRQSELISAFSIRVNYDIVSTEDHSISIKRCDLKDKMSCLPLVEYLFQAYNSAELYINKVEELSGFGKLASLKPGLVKHKSNINLLMSEHFRLSIDDMKARSISTPREYLRSLDQSIVTNLSNETSIETHFADISYKKVKLLSKIRTVLNNEIEDNDNVMNSYTGLQGLFVFTAIVELVAFLLLNLIDIRINNE